MYQPYRGMKYERKKSRKFSVAIVILLALLIGLLIYMYAQNFIVISSDGVRFDFPFMNNGPAEPPALPDDPGDINLVIEKPPEIKPEPEPEPELTPRFGALAVDARLLSDEAYLEDTISNARALSLSSVLIDVKTQDGVLLYRGEDENTDVFQNAVSAFTGADLRVIARMDTFHDSNTDEENRVRQVKTSNDKTWLDNKNTRWLDPYKLNTRAYIKTIVRELTSLGVSEIVLDSFHFPYAGRLSYISYGEQTRTREEVLSQFLGELYEITKGKAVLNVVLLDTVFETGAEEISGQDIKMLAPYLDRFVILSDATNDLTPLNDTLSQIALHEPDILKGRGAVIFSRADSSIAEAMQNEPYENLSYGMTELPR